MMYLCGAADKSALARVGALSFAVWGVAFVRISVALATRSLDRGECGSVWSG
jgi:hypothetical protein